MRSTFTRRFAPSRRGAGRRPGDGTPERPPDDAPADADADAAKRMDAADPPPTPDPAAERDAPAEHPPPPPAGSRKPPGRLGAVELDLDTVVHPTASTHPADADADEPTRDTGRRPGPARPGDPDAYRRPAPGRRAVPDGGEASLRSGVGRSGAADGPLAPDRRGVLESEESGRGAGGRSGSVGPGDSDVDRGPGPGRRAGADVDRRSVRRRWGPGRGGEGGSGERGRGAVDAHDAVASALGAQMGVVEAALRAAVADGDDGIAGTFDSVMARDRSRLRARLVLLSAAAVGGGAAPSPAVITAAAAVELLHLAQRHHDTRHVDARQAGEADVLVGDHLMARAVQLAIAVDAAAGEAVGRCVVARVRGQLLDDRDRYCLDRLLVASTESCRARTAALTATAAALGARLAGGNDEQVAALRTYGDQLGLALQLTDDLRDVVTDAPDTGHDLRTGIYTLPTLAAIHEAGELRAVLGRPLDPAALAHATQVVRRSGGVALALSHVHRHVTEATAALDGLPTPAGLDQLAHGIGHRAWHLAADQPVVDLPRGPTR